MIEKTYVPQDEEPPVSQVGATLEALASTISARRDAGDESYTHRLLSGPADDVLKKVMEEAGEVALAAKDVEAWACSSLAATLAVEGTPDADAAGETLDVKLPSDYFEAVDHLRYETADVMYHMLVVLERYGISLEEFAAELNNRMNEDERPRGGVRLYERYVRRGKNHAND